MNLTKSKDFLSGLFEGVYIVNPKRKIIYWNQGSEKITGYSAEEVMNKYCFNNILRHVDTEGNELCMNGCPLHATLSDGKERVASVFLHHKNGHRVPVEVRSMPLYNDDNEIIGAVEVFTDSRYQKEAYEENQRLQELLITDELTQVYNRRYLDFKLKNYVTEFEEFNQHFGVLFIDIDKFKSVNDTYGHQIGDEILKLVSRTIKNNIRGSDVFGRWGGEEFILIAKIGDIEKLERFANKLRMLIYYSTFKDENHKINVTVSIGGAFYKEGMSVSKLVEASDKNMYQAKQTGRNKVVVD